MTRKKTKPAGKAKIEYTMRARDNSPPPDFSENVSYHGPFPGVFQVVWTNQPEEHEDNLAAVCTTAEEAAEWVRRWGLNGAPGVLAIVPPLCPKTEPMEPDAA